MAYEILSLDENGAVIAQVRAGSAAAADRAFQDAIVWLELTGVEVRLLVTKTRRVLAIHQLAADIDEENYWRGRDVFAKIGRPVSVRASNRTLTLDDETIRIFKQLGGGNISQGARTAAQKVAKMQADDA